METAVRPSEKEIYQMMWEKDIYRITAPGSRGAYYFLAQANPSKGASVIDFGCGTGRGGKELASVGLDVTLVDFAGNCLDKAVRDSLGPNLRFIEADLTQPLMLAAEYGFCTDVLEHIQPDKVDAVLNNILSAARHVYFQIGTEADHLGMAIGHPLHLTVKPYEWWLQKFTERNCTVYKSREYDRGCSFFVSAWIDGKEVVEHGELNIDIEKARQNVKHNIAQGWMQIEPCLDTEVEVMLVGGSPSLAQFEHQIKRMRAEGVKLVTLNGSYNWCLDHGLVPSAQIIVDARAFNARFSHPVVDNCKYLIASQCDPSVLEGLPIDRTYLWHTTAETFRDVLNEHYGQVWWGVPGGSTVLLRAIPLMRMLGFKRFHLYGCDSCLSDDETHHAYEQTENDMNFVVPVCVTGGRIFNCHPWMVSQGQEFIDLIKVFGNEMELAVYGDGLLAHILNMGASMPESEVELTGE